MDEILPEKHARHGFGGLLINKNFYFRIEISRTPRGLSGSLDSNAYARCRACREGCVSNSKAVNIVDGLNYDGVIYRTMSGWKHSSIKVTFAGVVTLVKRYWLRSWYLLNSIGSGTV